MMEETQVAQLPVETLKKFNWGAFLLNWIWGLGNKTYLPLIVLPIAFIPFGSKGNEWAWQNKQWMSVEHFDDVQKKWALAAVIVLVASFVLGLLIGILGGVAAVMSGGVQ